MAGFATPLALLAGFIFGSWLGTLILVFWDDDWCNNLYIIANYFFKEIIKEKF